MHRFRKKSDAKRPQLPETLSSTISWSQQSTLDKQHNNPQDSLPALPPASDFRTSLILPSLSRRFTLLRDSNGDPVSLNDVRSKFAEQRAQGAEHQISEEEEEMVVQALSEIQTTEPHSSLPPTPANTAAVFSPGVGSTFATQQDGSTHLSAGGDADFPNSISSGITPSIASSPSLYPRSIPSSPSSSARYSSKRNSNNLFGSGRFHDTSYIRSVNKTSVGSNRSTTSLVGSDSHGGSIRSTHSSREVETSGKTMVPDVDHNGDYPPSPGKNPPPKAWAISYTPLSALPPRLSKDFTPQQAKRASAALEQAIRGIEEEAEETIMVPRTSISRAGTMNSRTQSPKLESPSAAGTPIPWMTDEARVDDRDEDDPAPSTVANKAVIPVSPSSSPSPGPYPRPGTTSPTPRLPGYIPGMTRPLTPRDFDSDDGATGYSTTPRARSPAQSSHSAHTHPLPFSSSRHHHQPSLSEGQSILPPSILRSSRGSTQMSPSRTTSPGLNTRSRGNSASSPQAPSPVPSPAPEERFKNQIPPRRPLSPLALESAGYSSSRPGTPSAGFAWPPPPSSPLAQVHTVASPPCENDLSQPDLGGHRNGSALSTDSFHGDTIHAYESGALPVLGTWAHSQNANQNRNGTASSAHGIHHDSSVSSIDLGQPSNSPRTAAAAKIAARVPTPVNTHSRSVVINNSVNDHDPILLNRTVSRRAQKRMPTPPPHVQPIQFQAQTPPAMHTPSSSSNSSSNVNLNFYSNPSPMFSPMLNTSASSLLSDGSSYRSWADQNVKKSGWDQLVEYDSQRSAWQDILNSGGTAETDDTSETEALDGPEQVLRSLTGLTRGDLTAIQKKLVTDALSRKGFDPPRSPTTRRRRMSNPRASYSVAQPGRESGANSPAPRQPTPAAENGPTPPSPDSTSRANALLDSVLNSIQSQSTVTAPASTVTASDVTSAEPSSTIDDDASSKLPSSISSSGRESREEESSALRYKALADAIENEQPACKTSDQEKQTSSASEPIHSHEEDSGEATEVPASQSWRNPPVPIPSNSSVQLVREVSRKAAAATAALKSPSQTKTGESETIRRRPTKRIDPQHISSPQFVSSSTSVNAIPITHQTLSRQTSPTTSDPRSSKLSQRFKKLRGTLLTKPPSRDGEAVQSFGISSPQNSSQSPLDRFPSPAAQGSQAQTLVYAQQRAPPASATERGRFKVTVPSPPVSAGPSLKGFMARFRRPRKETVTIPKDRPSQQSPTSLSPVSPPQEREHVQTPHDLPTSPTTPRRSEDYVNSSVNRARSPTPDPATVNQLFNAAFQLGLDRNALDELVARSTSTSSRNTTWTQDSTTAFAERRSNSVANRAPTLRARENHSTDQPRVPEQPPKVQPRPNATVNRHPDGEIIRRTIIFAGDNASAADLNGLARKDSISGRPERSPSAASIHSTGSVIREPPVPRLPASLGRTHSAKPSDSSSFYDVYIQDASFSNAQNGCADGSGNPPPLEERGQGPALEVLHLSNGQVIWSVLDSLRQEDEDDSESLFRRSMSSSRGNDVDDMEVRFKEHRRLDSKGSGYSQGSHNSRRRPHPGPSGARPETKLFKTNSSTIGRLIEDLSKNMDSGSFNFNRPATASPASTSFHSDASGPSRQVERDLEALLNAINPRSGS